MTNLPYMSMKFIIWNELFVAKFIIESDWNLFNKHDIRRVLIVVRVVVVIFFFIYVMINLNENDVVNDFSKRLVVRFIIVILFVFEINEQQRFVFWFNILRFIVIHMLRSTLLIVINLLQQLLLIQKI